MSPREYLRLVRELSKISRESSEALHRLQAAGRLNAGEAGAITEHRHTGSVGLEVSDDPEVQAERRRRLEHMLDMHARKRAYVPGSYQGEEQGIVDVEAEPVV